MRRFWTLYALSWIPLGVAYTVIFLLDRPETLPSAAVAAALINILTAALLGAGAVALSRRMRWRRDRARRFVLVHAVASLLYSGAWLVIVLLGLETEQWLITREWDPWSWWRGPALRWQLFQGVIVYGLIAGVTYAVEFSAEAARIEKAAIATELHALRAQLNPHFLFNTLHTVGALVRYDPPAAETAVERLGAMLRYTLDIERGAIDDVSLAEELAFVRDYIELERLRLGERLRLDIDVAREALAVPIPAFTLQPLVENAIRHGVAPHAAGGQVNIAAKIVDDERLRLEVSNDRGGSVSGDGSGLRLIAQRLESRYRGRASLQIEPQPHFRVTVTIPLEE